MGIRYALLKVHKPEVFELGKGSASRSWMDVFNRKFGLLWDVGNFQEPITGLTKEKLVAKLKKYDRGYSGDAEEVAGRIIDWVGEDTVILTNLWEEVTDYRDDMPDLDLSEEYPDTQELLTPSFNDYLETGNVWNGSITQSP